jgi:hypothetical protein
MASGFYSRASNAFNEPVTSAAFEPAVMSTNVASPPVTRARYVAPRTVTVRDTAPVTAKKNRSWRKEVLIVGGSAGGGAAIGAIAGGKKGAAIGAISGGIAGLVYDLATRNRN